MNTIIELPLPPSVNRLWRNRRGRSAPYTSPRYATWKRAADNAYLANKRAWAPIHGHFRAVVTLNAAKRGNSDADNRLKALFDWLQRVELIENDKLCDTLTVEWGYAPEGCRVALFPAPASARRAA